MNKIIFGKYTSPHGINGEIKLLSHFKYKSRVLQINNKIIIDNKEYSIKSYSTHKNYDMVTLDGINDINSIPFKNNSLVYINRDDYLNYSDYLDEDLIGFTVENNNFHGNLDSIRYITDTKKVLVCGKKLLPYEWITNVNLEKKVITIMEVLGI